MVSEVVHGNQLSENHCQKQGCLEQDISNINKAVNNKYLGYIDAQGNICDTELYFDDEGQLMWNKLS